MNTYDVACVTVVLCLVGWLPITVFLNGIANIINALKGNNNCKKKDIETDKNKG